MKASLLITWTHFERPRLEHRSQNVGMGTDDQFVNPDRVWLAVDGAIGEAIGLIETCVNVSPRCFRTADLHLHTWQVFPRTPFLDLK